jgi:cytochrome c oxidase subunit 2
MLNWMRWLPDNAATFGGDIDGLLGLIYTLTVVWFALTFGVLGLFLVLYRRRPGRPAAHVTGERPRELLWVLVPVAVVLVLDLWVDFRGAPVWAKVKIERPASDVAIQVTGRQFNWEIVYPGPDGRFGTADDKLFVDEMHVPLGRPVRVTFRSRDVIHSFFLPHFRLKQDAVPGRAIEGWFEATRAGSYELPCAQLCGFGHSGMKAMLHVHPPAEYARWVAEQGA